MLKRCLWLALLLLIGHPPVLAAGHVQSGIKAALDEFNYMLSVEWDQFDSDFYHAQVANLQHKVRQFRRNGFLARELWQASIELYAQPHYSQDLQRLFTQLERGELTSAVAWELIQEITSWNTIQGAQWLAGGQTMKSTGLYFVLLGLVLPMDESSTMHELVEKADSGR